MKLYGRVFARLHDNKKPSKQKNMNKLFRLSASILIIFLIVSCKSNKQPLLPSVTGRPGDLLIVINSPDWDSEAGEELKRVFDQPYEGLPQYEPLFDMMHISHDDFSNVLKTQRNIINVEIMPRYTEPKIRVQKDLWANSQLIINMYADSDQQFVKLLKENETRIINVLEDMERERLSDIHRKNFDKDLHDKLLNQFGVSLLIPKGYNLDVDSANFAWMSMDVSSILLNVIVYTYNYKDTNTFTKDYLIDKRNEITKKYIHGETEGSYMTTETEYGPFFSEYMLRGKRYVAELRGLWKMEHGIAMGGPFISITTLDERTNKIITVEGFVFAAGHNKRNYLRQVEAIILSLEIPKE